MTSFHPSLAQLTMRLRIMTGDPVDVCKEFLQALQEDKRLLYVEYMEKNKSRFFVDPVELDDAVRAKLIELQSEGRQLYDQGKFGRGKGSGRKMDGWIQSEMLARHCIR